MHAVGPASARLPAARCFRAQAQARAHTHSLNHACASRYSGLRLSARVAPLAPLLCSPRTQSRYLSSKPPDDSHDKPESKEEHDGDSKDKGEHAQTPASSETTQSPTDSKNKALFSAPGGRNRADNSGGSSNGMPPVTFPQWFLDDHVQLLEAHKPLESKPLDKIWRYVQPGASVPGSVQDVGGIWTSPENSDATPNSPERAIGRELLSTISAELEASAPLMRATKEPNRRPISLLYVHGYKGARIAKDIVSQIAAEAGADAIHLDAARLARIVGPYLGSTLYFGRCGMSMLGYAVADANGRSTSAGAPVVEGDEEIVISQLSVMSLLKQRSDDRATWDDLKLKNVLKEIVKSATAKRKLSGSQTSKPNRLILHIHNYVELMMTPDGTTIIKNLRSVVDRMWQDGSKIVIVGSASHDSSASARWHAKVKDMSNSDCYPIVFSPKTDELPEIKSWEQNDYLQDNLNNINWMIECLTSKPTHVKLSSGAASDSVSDDGLRDLITNLSSTIFSNNWVYRLATQAVGLQRNKDEPFEASMLADALKHMKMVDEARSTILGLLTPPDSTPASPISPSSNPLESLMSSGSTVSQGSKAGNRRRKPNSNNLEDEEKKLLSGLVNVADIHTTFQEVIAPKETRESLLSLTTLSLSHPKAFSYGVLARERIHGALVYGPPGTGKTLMAKALAKESGANMLEISAASINDMWVGNSEKNVRAVFSLARKMSPMVVFLDEADSLLGSRGRQPNRGGYRETINQFLREWDGLTNSINTQQIFMMVSTNRPQDLDEAVLRRLPRRILVDLPLRDARLAILQSLLRDEVLGPEVSLENLATETELYSGSDLKNLAVAAAMEAAKEELAAKNSHIGPDEYEFPEKRVIKKAHIDKALRDITASISEDMQSLKALRKFDEMYGDARRKKKKSGIGFEVVPHVASSEEARVRNR